MSETPLSSPSEAGGEPSIHPSSVEIIPLYRIQADIAVQKKWIAAATVPKAESLFTQWRSRGRRIDLAEAIAEVAAMSQADLEDLRKLALVESLRVAPPAGETPVASAVPPPARPPISPQGILIRRVAIGAAILAVGIAAGFLLRSKGDPDGGAPEYSDAGSGDGVSGGGDSGKRAPPVSEPGRRTDPPKADPPKADPPKADPPKQDPPKQEPPRQDPPKEEPVPTPPPGADRKELQEWLLALPDRQLARIVGTPLLDETISQILSGGDPVEVDQFLARFNDRLRQVQDIDRRPK